MFKVLDEENIKEIFNQKIILISYLNLLGISENKYYTYVCKCSYVNYYWNILPRYSQIQIIYYFTKLKNLSSFYLLFITFIITTDADEKQKSGIYLHTGCI